MEIALSKHFDSSPATLTKSFKSCPNPGQYRPQVTVKKQTNNSLTASLRLTNTTGTCVSLALSQADWRRLSPCYHATHFTAVGDRLSVTPSSVSQLEPCRLYSPQTALRVAAVSGPQSKAWQHSERLMESEKNIQNNYWCMFIHIKSGKLVHYVHSGINLRTLWIPPVNTVDGDQIECLCYRNYSRMGQELSPRPSIYISHCNCAGLKASIHIQSWSHNYMMYDQLLWETTNCNVITEGFKLALFSS